MTNEGVRNKRSILGIGALMLALAALQSPLWRPGSGAASIAVTEGGATLIASERDIAQVAVSGNDSATAEIVGNHEVLVRGKSRGETRIAILAKDGRTLVYRVNVQPDRTHSSASMIVR